MPIRPRSILQRKLIEPEPAVIGEMHEAFIAKIGEADLPPNKTVRLMRPGALAVPLVGSGVINAAVAAASPNSELYHMNAQQITDSLANSLSRLPSYWQPLGARAVESCITGSARYPIFATQLGSSAFPDECLAGLIALHNLANLDPPESPNPPTITWVSFRSKCPPGLGDELTEIANTFIPPGSDVLFGDPEPFDLTNGKSPYVLLG